jgi:hypothetical protein
MNTKLVFGLLLVVLQGGISAHGGQMTDSPQKNSPMKLEGSILWRKACSHGFALLVQLERQLGLPKMRTPDQIETLLDKCLYELEGVSKSNANKMGRCMLATENLIDWSDCKGGKEKEAAEKTAQLVICCFEAGGRFDSGVCIFYDHPLTEYDTEIYVQCAGSSSALYREIDHSAGGNYSPNRETGPAGSQFANKKPKNAGKSSNSSFAEARTGNSSQARLAETINASSQNNQTWKDSKSGLTWQVTPTSGKIQYSQVWQHCNALKWGGGGWRVPTISELRSLIRGCVNTVPGGKCGLEEECSTLDSMDEPCFVNVSCKGCSKNKGPGLRDMYWPPELQGEGVRYWSATSFSMDGGYGNWVRTIDFDNASINQEMVFDLRGNPYEGGEMTARHVRCVR